MADSDAWVALGVVGGPHGVRGGLRVKLYNPDSDLLFELPKVWLRGAGRALEPHAIEHAQDHGTMVLLQLAGMRTREAAEALRGVELCVPRSALPALDAGEHYVVDLIGMLAVNPAGEALGPVVDVQRYPASQVLCLDLPAGRYEVPAITPYLVDVLHAERRVVVDRLEDLEPVPARATKKRGPR